MDIKQNSKFQSRTESSAFKLGKKEYDPSVVGQWKGKKSLQSKFIEMYIIKTFPYVDKVQHIDFMLYDKGDKYVFDTVKDIKNIVPDLKKLLKDKDIYYIIFPVSWIYNYDADKAKYIRHTNYYIYDKNKYIIERFEPNIRGPNDLDNGDGIHLGPEILLKKIKKYLPLQFRKKCKKDDLEKCEGYYSTRLCASRLFQDIEVRNCNKAEFNIFTEGFCALWSLYLIELRFLNPKSTLQTLINKALKQLVKKENDICTFIRGYVKFVWDVTNYSYNKQSLIPKRHSPKDLINVFNQSFEDPTFVKCKIGKERSLRTGRCIKECKKVQYRNPITNRCKSRKF